MVLDAKRAGELFQQMREAAEHPEKAKELAHPPREKRLPKRETKPVTPPALDYLRAWEQKQETQEVRLAELAKRRKG